ncbi:MAG: hypothetical protein ACOX0O_02675 [Candidatus Methanoculleus thermohydrogenotrophicum]
MAVEVVGEPVRASIHRPEEPRNPGRGFPCRACGYAENADLNASVEHSCQGSDQRAYCGPLPERGERWNRKPPQGRELLPPYRFSHRHACLPLPGTTP